MDPHKTATFAVTSASHLKWLHWPADFPVLSQVREKKLARAVLDVRDTARYVIAAAIMPGEFLYYRVEDAGFCGDIAHGTLFKNRRAAYAVRKTIRGVKLRAALKILKVSKTASEVRLAKKPQATSR